MLIVILIIVCSHISVSCITVISVGSPAEMCHLQVGDKILAVNGQKVADMSYEKWKRSMDEALQEGSLFMDIRRQGKNSKFVFKCLIWGNNSFNARVTNAGMAGARNYSIKLVSYKSKQVLLYPIYPIILLKLQFI